MNNFSVVCRGNVLLLTRHVVIISLFILSFYRRISLFLEETLVCSQGRSVVLVQDKSCDTGG